MRTGEIKFYAVRKGYGFIAQPDDEDIFFHINNFESDVEPREGMRVTYEACTSVRNGKPEAREVMPAEKSNG